jgi:RNA polymerase sigma-70 factor (ECF subfamily)
MRTYRAMRRAAGSPLAEEHAADNTDLVADRLTALTARRDLAVALAALSPGDRDVLLLVALAGLSHAEVAAALRIPYGTVGSRLSRARKKLRAALRAHHPAV